MPFNAKCHGKKNQKTLEGVLTQLKQTNTFLSILVPKCTPPKIIASIFYRGELQLHLKKTSLDAVSARFDSCNVLSGVALILQY